MLPSTPASQDTRPVPVLRAVLQLFATVTVGVTGVIGSGMTAQLHFDGDPGIAAVS